MGVGLSGTLVLAGVVPAASPPHRATDEAQEVAFLVKTGTAGSLATASLLAHLVEPRRETDEKPDSSALLRRAAALAPERPEILWLLLRDCQMTRCGEQSSLVERLRTADPANGAPLLAALGASQAGPPPETTRLIAQIASSQALNLYWNRSVVMLFDAMTHGPHASPATAITHDADDRLTHATGVLAAIDVPPFKPIIAVCASGQFREAGRRPACEALMQRLDASDSIIAQSLSVSVQANWWERGSPEAEALRSRRQQLEYLVQASGRVRSGRVNADAELRVAAMRDSRTEADADRAVLTAFHEPLERPAGWETPTTSAAD